METTLVGTEKVKLARVRIPFIEGAPRSKGIKRELVRSDIKDFRGETKSIGALSLACVEMVAIGRDAPPAGEGYDKCDVVLEWEDGESYAFRFDVQNGGCNSSGADLRQQILRSLEIQAGRRKVAHWPEAFAADMTRRFAETGVDEFSRRVLDSYEL